MRSSIVVALALIATPAAAQLSGPLLLDQNNAIMAQRPFWQFPGSVCIATTVAGKPTNQCTITVPPVTTTLQQAYNNSAGANPSILLTAPFAGVTIRDAAAPIGATLLGVQNNGGTIKYLDVAATGVSTYGNLLFDPAFGITAIRMNPPAAGVNGTQLNLVGATGGVGSGGVAGNGGVLTVTSGPGGLGDGVFAPGNGAQANYLGGVSGNPNGTALYGTGGPVVLRSGAGSTGGGHSGNTTVTTGNATSADGITVANVGNLIIDTGTPIGAAAVAGTTSIGTTNTSSIVIGHSAITETFAGQALFSDGASSAAPGVAFSSDPGMGMYRAGANTLYIVTQGALGNNPWAKFAPNVVAMQYNNNNGFQVNTGVAYIQAGIGRSLQYDGTTFRADSGVFTINGPSGTVVEGSVADAVAAVANVVDNTVSLPTVTAKLVSFRNNTVEKASISSGGNVNIGAFATGSLPGTCTDGSLAWDSTAATVKRCKTNTWASFATASEWDFSASTALALIASSVALQQAKVTNAATIEAATLTPFIAGTGASTFIAKLCSDGASCADAAHTYVTCTTNCTTTAGTVVACTVNTAAVPAATTLTWSVNQACGTLDPASNMVVHFTNP